MTDRPSRHSRFRTPPDLHSPTSPNSRKSKPEFQNADVISEITADKKTETRVILPQTIEDIFYLIQTHPNISEIRWLKYTNGVIHLVLYSKGSDPKGYGGLCLFEDEFIIVNKRLEDYPHIELIEGNKTNNKQLS